MRGFGFVLASAFMLTGIAVAQASDADFSLRNKTGYQIDEVYVSGHSSKSWGHDIMGRDALGDGETVKITFPHGGSACHFDIKVKYHDDDSTAEWSDVDLCQFGLISIFWDERSQVTRAVGE